jgi:hypothetical protein
MDFKGFNKQIIVITFLGLGLLGYALATTNAYALVKITSPAKGQHVSVGNIVVSGTSSSNSTNRCTVSVILNGLKPYQPVTPLGNKAPSDYSNWTFTATPKYTTIKEGMNKITAKYSCPQNSNLTKFYSVNVTGVASKIGLQQPTSSSNKNNTNATSSVFPPSLPSVATQLMNESKHSKILK